MATDAQSEHRWQSAPWPYYLLALRLREAVAELDNRDLARDRACKALPCSGPRAATCEQNSGKHFSKHSAARGTLDRLNMRKKEHHCRTGYLHIVARESKQKMAHGPMATNN